MTTDVKATRTPDRGMFRRPRVRLGAVLAIAVAGGFIAWLAIGRGSSSSPTDTVGPVAKPTGPVALSASGLRTIAGAVQQPIYWAGPKSGYKYEFTRTATGKVFIRYLPPGVKAGAPGSNYLIVATYPFANAMASLQAGAKGREISLAGGGIALVDKAYPKSVHVAFPGVGYQIEVYDPSPARAREAATSGDIQPSG